MSLDATVKGVSANSYLTATEATTILTDGRLFSSVWSAASTPDKERALIWATSLIDSSFSFEGQKTTQAQALRWPRIGLVDVDDWYIDQDTLPKDLKFATAELAMSLLSGDRTLMPDLLGQGFSKAKVGPIEVTVDRNQVNALFPAHVSQLLENIGGSTGGAGGGGLAEMRLERT